MLRTLIFCLFTACTALPAPAQELQCAPADAVMADVERQGYQLSFMGDADGNALMIVTGPKGWIAIVKRDVGDMCIVGMGEDWQLKQSGVAS